MRELEDKLFEVMNCKTGSLPHNDVVVVAVLECRFRSRSAFDSFSIASEAFSEQHQLRSFLHIPTAIALIA